MRMDYYKILGVERTATADEIKIAYRRLAAKNHPDRGGDTAKFQEIQTAYDTLSDPEKRLQYDQPQRGHHPFNHGDPGFHFDMNVNGFNINEMFQQMFRQHQSTPVYRSVMTISLEQAFNGGEQTLRLQTGSKTHLVKINIPPGIMDGGQIKYDNVINGASLVVEFRIHPHLKYERRGNDLYCNHPISVLDLIAGTKFIFTCIDGREVEVPVPPGTQPTASMKLSGCGLPIMGTTIRGDQYLTIKPFIPQTIDSSIIAAIKSSQR